jgi:hypothetical protein
VADLYFGATERLDDLPYKLRMMPLVSKPRPAFGAKIFGEDASGRHLQASERLVRLYPGPATPARAMTRHANCRHIEYRHRRGSNPNSATRGLIRVEGANLVKG